MVEMYKGTLVEESLEDVDILRAVEIDKDSTSEDWHIYRVRITEDQIPAIQQSLRDGPWYTHFWKEGEDEVLIVFKTKVFKILYSDRFSWKDAILYGESIGIPREQLDFLID